MVVANAENAADGSGLRATDYRRLIQHGVDVVTLGDHIYRKQEIIEVLLSQSNIVRPANMPEQAPGRQWALVEVGQQSLAVISLIDHLPSMTWFTALRFEGLLAQTRVYYQWSRLEQLDRSRRRTSNGQRSG